jgi:hypothetical protein
MDKTQKCTTVNDDGHSEVAEGIFPGPKSTAQFEFHIWGSLPCPCCTMLYYCRHPNLEPVQRVAETALMIHNWTRRETRKDSIFFLPSFAEIFERHATPVGYTSFVDPLSLQVPFSEWWGYFSLHFNYQIDTDLDTVSSVLLSP